MKGMIRLIHFEIYKLKAKEEEARANHSTVSPDERIRKDQTIIEIQNTRKILDFLEGQAYNRI